MNPIAAFAGRGCRADVVGEAGEGKSDSRAELIGSHMQECPSPGSDLRSSPPSPRFATRGEGKSVGGSIFAALPFRGGLPSRPPVKCDCRAYRGRWENAAAPSANRSSGSGIIYKITLYFDPTSIGTNEKPRPNEPALLPRYELSSTCLRIDQNLVPRRT